MKLNKIDSSTCTWIPIKLNQYWYKYYFKKYEKFKFLMKKFYSKWKTCGIILLGMINKGYNLCYLYMDQTHVRKSDTLRKIVYDEFRMFFDGLHPFRTKLKDLFNGYVEARSCSYRLAAYDWTMIWNNFMVSQSSTPRTSFQSVSKSFEMKRYSIIYELEYCRVQHLLDPRHITKNLCKSLIKHLIWHKNFARERNDWKYQIAKKYYRIFIKMKAPN